MLKGSAGLTGGAALSLPLIGEIGAELNQHTIDSYTSNVPGREPIETLDEMISEWRERGGDQMRQEHEEAIAAAEEAEWQSRQHGDASPW